MVRLRPHILALAATVLLAAPSFAIEPGEALKDPALETRARTLSAVLRCLVCQNQSIEDSQAPLAKDLRLLVRERLTAGDSDRQVLDFLVARYGDFILLKPPFRVDTLLLWGTPALVLAFGALALALKARRRTTTSTLELTGAEKAELERLLKG